MPPEWSRLLTRAVLIVAAHPDDEVIGAGSLLPTLADPHLLHVTDGAPRNLADALAAGYATRKEYAAARRGELEAVLALAGIPPERALEVGVVDQEAMRHLEEIVAAVAARLRQFRPAWVLTHPYEGGHPDHDACAFAVHAAVRLVEPVPPVVEWASYHHRGGEMVTGEFLPNGGGTLEIPLSLAARQLKRRMFDCYASQQHMLKNFGLERERLRPAPEYDFTRPPHPGALLYERFGWASGEDFREFAGEVLRRLAIHQPL